MAPLAVVKISTHSWAAAWAWHAFRNAADPNIGWSGLLNKIGYNLKLKGCHLVKIDQWFPSSKPVPAAKWSMEY